MLFGLSGIMGAACVFNNIIDRDIDKKMDRTKNRALVLKTISIKSALIYAISLSIIGSAILYFFTNLLTLSIALLGLFFYVVVYGIAKRRTVHGTLIGCISGAVPPVVGYTAVTNQLDIAALLLFLILIFWQMPHFYAIALYRLKDYKNAKIPVMPLIRGLQSAKYQILFYIGILLIVSSLLTLFHYTGYVYLSVMAIVCLVWFGKGIRGLRVEKDLLWAKSMFRFSLVVICVFSVMVSLGSTLP